MTVLRARAVDAQGQPVPGRTAVLEPWTGNRYRNPYIGPSVVRGLTAVSGSDGWMSWTLPDLQRRSGPQGALWLVTGLEEQPVVLATQGGDTTTTGIRVGTVNPAGDLVLTTAGAPDSLAEVAAELQGRLSDESLHALVDRSILVATLNAAFDAPSTFLDVVLPTVETDSAESYDAATGYYTIPVTGDYDVLATVRRADAFPAAGAKNLGIGVDTEGVTDTPYFSWYPLTDALRQSFLYNHTRHLAGGARIRLFTYGDNNGRVGCTSASLSVVLLRK